MTISVLSTTYEVDKKNGRTQMKFAAGGRLQQDLAPLGVDEAWLSNWLGGGLHCILLFGVEAFLI